MPEQPPLFLRMYQRPPMVALVQAIGYREIPISEGKKIVEDLAAKFGKEVIQAASQELTEVKFDNGNELARLKPHVRKLAHQLLGPDPNVKTQSIAEFLRLDQPNGEAPAETKPAKPKRTRKKKSDTVPPAGAGMVDAAQERVEPDTPKKALAVPADSWLPEYREAKEKHPGMIILFRRSDFYEAYHEDAETISKALGLTLTSRDTFTMAGFPYHQLEVYLRKLLQGGLRVAICEPTDIVKDPLKREVTRVVTPARTAADGPYAEGD